MTDTSKRPDRLRDESTPEGKAIWAAVDKVVARTPRWMKERFDLWTSNQRSLIEKMEHE